MKGYAPSILIWNLELREKNSDFPFQNIYFFTCKGVERFIKKNKEELSNYYWSYGAERLWFW